MSESVLAKATIAAALIQSGDFPVKGFGDETLSEEAQAALTALRRATDAIYESLQDPPKPVQTRPVSWG